MPRHINPPKTIAERGGLKVHLDETANYHNGLRYRDFVNRINPKRKHKVPKAVIAEDFDVSSRTVYAWIRIYNAEQATSRPSETTRETEAA
jgi:transposase